MRNFLFLTFINIGFSAFSQIIGGRNNSEMTPRVAEATKLSGGGYSGDVNLMTGEYNASLPLGSVSTPAGLSFGLELNWSSTFSYGSNRPTMSGVPYGEGWNPNIPSISIETKAFHKFSCFQKSGANAQHLDYTILGDSLFSGRDEGDLFWYAPTIHIPGVASGRAVFKYVDVQDDNCLVFAMHTFESPVEVRCYGNNWVVIAANGNRYEFNTVVASYTAPSNQRVLHYDQDSLSVRNLSRQSAIDNNYETFTETVQSAIEPKKAYHTWYCDKIMNTMYPLQFIVFQYETFGEFNYFAEFDQARYQHVKSNVFNSGSNTNYTTYSDVLLKEVASYVMDSPYEIMKLDYALPENISAGDYYYDPNGFQVERVDSLYTRKVVRTWDSDFNGWRRYRHQAAISNNGQFDPANPYVSSSGTYNRQGVSGNEVSFGHGFLESPRVANSEALIAGDLYELRTTVRRSNSTNLDDGNGTLDISIVSGDEGYLENTDLGVGVYPNSSFEVSRGLEVFSTFNTALKWQMGYGQEVLETSNLFRMPNLSTERGGYNIQIGPGNSDIDFGADDSDANYYFFVNNTVPDARKIYPHYFATGRQVNSTANIPHNFGTGHPWGMMIPVYNMMALSNSTTLNWSNATPDQLYRTWWSVNNALNGFRPNIPTKFSDNVKLDKVELLRYTKLPYMLVGVKVYKVNGEYSQQSANQIEGVELISDKKLEYGFETLPIRKELNYSEGQTIEYESRMQMVILLKRMREMPLDTLIADTNQWLTTYLGYVDVFAQSNALPVYSSLEPHNGHHQLLLNRYVDHLGQITGILYHSFYNGSPSRSESLYSQNDCDIYNLNNSASEPFPFGSSRSWSAHAAVAQIVRNDESDIATNAGANPFLTVGGKKWTYEFDQPIVRLKNIQLPEYYFRSNQFNRVDRAFGKVTVREPDLDQNGTYNFTEYHYYGDAPGNLTMDGYLLYGKTKEIKSYQNNPGGVPILHDQKIFNYAYTLAHENAWDRPNYLREQLGYDHLQIRQYEYEDIYMGIPLDATMQTIIYFHDTTNNIYIPIDTNYVPVTGDLAKIAAAPPYLNGQYSDREQARLLEFYFYDTLTYYNPEYMLQSWFVKKTSEQHRVYDNGLAKGAVQNPNPVELPVDRSYNPHGSGITNPVSANPSVDDDLIATIQTGAETAVEELLLASPLSDTVLRALIAATAIPDPKKADVLAIQGGLSNAVWLDLISLIQHLPPQKMENIVHAQPYFSDPVLTAVIQDATYLHHSSTIEAILTKNDYLSDAVIMELNGAPSIPGDAYEKTLSTQAQFSETTLQSILLSDNLRSVNLSLAMNNQYLTDQRYLQIIADNGYHNQDIVRLIENGLTYPSDSVLIVLLNRNPKLSPELAERALKAAPRELDQAVLNRVDQLYPAKVAARIKPDKGDGTGVNGLNQFCNAPLNQNRRYIETRTDYEYYEADFKGRAVGKPYELLFGLISAYSEPSAFPFTITQNAPAFSNGLDAGRVLPALLLKHQPSWQIASVTTTSPHYPDAFNREEYFYYYDLQNRYDRHWFNYSREDEAVNFMGINLYQLGNEVDTLAYPLQWGNYYASQDTLLLPPHDGMVKSRQHGSRDLAFQKSTLSKNNQNEKPLLRSEYYFYNSRWKYDDLPAPALNDSFPGAPCAPPPVNDCADFLDLPNVQWVFFKPAYMNPGDLTPLYFCLWLVEGSYYLVPQNIEVTDYCGNASLIYCNAGYLEDQKALPFYLALNKSLLLKNVTVQVDTLDHSEAQEFTSLRLDPGNEYIAEFFTDEPGTPDADGFAAAHHMIYPFDNLTVRTIDQRNRYLQPALEHNQVDLYTKYYYNKSQAFQNNNTNCPGDAYMSIVNQDIGLPTRICVGYYRPDSLSTAYAYTPKGQVRKVTEPAGKFLEYVFDHYQRLTGITENGNRFLTQIEYNNWLHDFSLNFDDRTEENFVQTRTNNSDPLLNTYDHEVRKAFLDPLARNHSVVSAYTDGSGNYQQIHSGTVKYDNWSRPIQSYKNFEVLDTQLRADEDTLKPYAETIYDNDPKARARRTSNYGVLATANEVVRTNYAIANYIYINCELGLSAQEVSLVMGNVNRPNFQLYRTEVYDQDNKRSVEYSNAFGQKIATLSYNDNNQKIVTLFLYDSYGNLTTVINPEKQRSHYAYNILGQMTIEKTVDARAKHYLYNKQGLVSAMQDEQGRMYINGNGVSEPFYRVYKYDIYGRLLQVGRHISGFDYNRDAEYPPLNYQTSFVGAAPNQTVNYEFDAQARYFDYEYTNASSQDWLLQYDVFRFDSASYPNSFLTMSGFDNLFQIERKEKEYIYGGMQGVYELGKLLMSRSYDNAGVEVLRCEYTYDVNGNIASQLVRFNEDQAVMGSPTDLLSKITYPAYNFRNALLEERIDVDNDGTVDFHLFIRYDALNRLESIAAATQQVASISDATRLVGYTYDDANGLLIRKAHYADQYAANGYLNTLVQEIEYSYDTRDRLTNLSAGQFEAGFAPMMDYSLFYDNANPTFVDGLTPVFVNNSNNFNGNINGTLMEYNFLQNDVYGGPGTSAFAKPTLYGYTYDKINRMTFADGHIGDFILQTGTLPEIANSYAIGDERLSYDRIGNILTLQRRLRGTTAYTEVEQYSYNYAQGTNRLSGVTGVGGTTSRVYTYDGNGNVLTDDYRNIAGTEYGRAAYAFHLDKGTDAVDYRYSVDDQRIFKREATPSGTTRDYYLIDAMGKLVALRHETPNFTSWEYYVSGSEREVKIPKGGNLYNSSRIVEKQASYYLYDHLGNTRVVYQPNEFVNLTSQLVSYTFDSGTDGWQGLGSTTVANAAGQLEATVPPFQNDPVYVDFASPYPGGAFYTVQLDATPGNSPGLTLIVPGVSSYPLVSGSNSVQVYIPAGVSFSGIQVSAQAATLNANGYTYHFDNVIVSSVSSYTQHNVEYVADYFPYGKIVREFSLQGGVERFLTTQHERDAETGLDYRGARYYDSDVARFLSLDPHARDYPSLSDYCYVAGNPIVYRDMNGKDYHPFDYEGKQHLTHKVKMNDDGSSVHTFIHVQTWEKKVFIGGGKYKLERTTTITTSKYSVNLDGSVTNDFTSQWTNNSERIYKEYDVHRDGLTYKFGSFESYKGTSGATQILKESQAPEMTKNYVADLKHLLTQFGISETPYTLPALPGLAGSEKGAAESVGGYFLEKSKKLPLVGTFVKYFGIGNAIGSVIRENFPLDEYTYEGEQTRIGGGNKNK